MRIQDRIILVTGASEGIGRACVEEFRCRGAKVALVARNKRKLEEVAAPGDLVIAAALLQPESRKEAVQRCVEHFGRIDILVNNAGRGLSSPAWRTDLSQARQLYELNFFAPLELSQLAAAYMRSQRSGMIVNVGSVAGKVTMPWFSLYSSTKFALGALTSGLRMELASAGIHTMLVCPGFVKTEFHNHTLGGPPAGHERRGRPGEITPEQCAAAIAGGIERNARTIVTPKTAWLLIAASRLFPATVDRLLARTIERRM